MPEQEVAVYFDYESTDLGELLALEQELRGALMAASAGEYDGHEAAADGHEGCLYMYGADADAIWRAVEGVLWKCPFLMGAMVVRRYGPDQPEVTVLIGR